MRKVAFGVLEYPLHNAEWDRQVNLDAVPKRAGRPIVAAIKTAVREGIRNFWHPHDPAKGETQGEFKQRIFRRLTRKLPSRIVLPEREPIVWDCINRKYVATEDAMLWSEFTDVNDMNELLKKDSDFARARLAELKQKYGVE